MKLLLILLPFSLLALADETVHFSLLSTLQGEHYNKVKSATNVNHQRTHIRNHSFNSFYRKYQMEFDTLVATKYPTMTFYIGEKETLFTSSVDNNCTVPFNLPNRVKGIDITPACRAHDYCYMNNNRFSTNLDKSFEQCNEDFYQSLLQMCKERYITQAEKDEASKNKDCEECNHQLESQATGNTFNFVESVEETYAQMSRSFHRSGCETDMYLINQSVKTAGYSTFLHSQERAAQFTVDLAKLAKNKPDFAKDLLASTGVSLQEMVHGYINYCFNIHYKGYGEDYSERQLASFGGDVVPDYEVEKDLGNFQACNKENKVLVQDFVK